MYCHIGAAPDIMVWGGIGFSYFSPLIELLLLPACTLDLSPIENMWFMLAQRLARETPPTASPDKLRQLVEATWIAVPKDT
ncbi:UNVERIFIED_CONTAM: hypothetical protein NCL1_45999 [Trichonephila clavipes]